MNAQEIAERQGLTILSKEGENTFLCANETESGGIYLACWCIWDDELHRTIDRGQVYTREGINRIPHVADLLAALESLRHTFWLHYKRHPERLAFHYIPSVQKADAAISGARGIDETMRSV